VVPDVILALTVVVMLLPLITVPIIGLSDKEKSNSVDGIQFPAEQVYPG
jgi:hypothetical protein